MPPRLDQDVHALQLGFLADGVVQALVARPPDASPPNRHLTMGAALLRALAETAGPVTPASAAPLQLATLPAFGYAAEAARASHTPDLSHGLRAYFAALADSLEQLARGAAVSDEAQDQLTRFFRALSASTFERWSAAQAPTLLGPTPIGTSPGAAVGSTPGFAAGLTTFTTRPAPHRAPAAPLPC